MKRTSCLNCNVPFEPGRTDQMFCSDRCGSAYWKKHGTTHNHKDLPHFNCKDCETCGNQFWYNDYAQRGGKREPKFCSSRCRTRAFRAHKTSAEFAGKPPRQKAPPKAQTPPPFKTGNFRDAFRPPTRWNATEAFLWLGVPYDADRKTCQAAMRALNKQFHPDQNAGVIWPHLVHINAAFDYLKRKYWN